MRRILEQWYQVRRTGRVPPDVDGVALHIKGLNPRIIRDQIKEKILSWVNELEIESIKEEEI